jgi:hypothetical protein
MSREKKSASMPLTCRCMRARMPFGRTNTRDHLRPTRIRPLPGVIISLNMLDGLVLVIDVHRNVSHWLYGIVR